MKFSAAVLLVLLVVLGVVVQDVIGAREEVKESALRRRRPTTRDQARERRRERARNRRNRQRNRNRRPTTPQCPPIPIITNGQATMLTQTRAQIICSPGFRLEGTNVIACVNGNWVVSPRCVAATCPAPPTVAYANAPVVSGNTAIYTCLSGYQLSGGAATCNTANLMWMNIPICSQIPTQTCPAPPTITNGISTLNGIQATYTCNSGYMLSGSTATITCVNLAWPTVGLPMCVVDPTTTPTQNTTCRNVPGGDQFSVRASMVADSFAVGMSVPFTCVPGYRVVGSNNNANNSASIYCTANGTWTTRPTCEPVVCGLPPAGTNTAAIVTSCITYQCAYTYVCNSNYEFTGSLTSTCLANGMWSLTAPSCAQKMCLASALPTLANSVVVSTNYPIGTVLNYTCNTNYRLAPALPGSTDTVQTTTCQSDGTYTPLSKTCVYVHPTDCKDYFSRDNIFATTTVGTCQTVTLDPQGPALSDPTNPPAFQAQCCKNTETQCCTQVTPNSGTSIAPDGNACTAATTTLLPGATFTAGEGAACNTPTVTGYPLTNQQIAAMVASSNGSCSQQVTVTCTTGSNGDFLLLQCNGAGSGVAYGSNAVATSLTTAITPAPFANLGGQCDCASSGSPNAACLVGGCECTGSAALTTGATDTITKPITSDNLAYVTAIQAATIEAGGAWAGYSAAVGPIICCDTV